MKDRFGKEKRTLRGKRKRVRKGRRGGEKKPDDYDLRTFRCGQQREGG